MTKRELVDLEMWLHHETDGAVLVSLDAERDHAVWLPKSAVEVEPKRVLAHARRRGDFSRVVVTMTERLAIEKDLV